MTRTGSAIADASRLMAKASLWGSVRGDGAGLSGAGGGAGQDGGAGAGQGQPDEELAAGTGVAHRDLAGVRLDDAARDGQAEPGALLGSRGAGRFAAERDVEDAG